MRTVEQIAKEGTGVYVLKKGEIGQIMKACKAKKLNFSSFWTRKRKAAK